MEELASELLKELNCDTAFSIKLPAGLPLIGGVQLDIAESVVITWVVMAVILILSIILTSNLKVHNVSRRQLVAETIVTKLEGIVTGMIGEEELVALCVFDLNNLRIINNDMGHDRGDEYIRLFAELLREAVPKEFFTGRDGGDEFLVVLKGMDHSGVRECLQRIRDHVADYSRKNPQLPISYAAGYALSSDFDGCTMKDLFCFADKNMLETMEKCMSVLDTYKSSTYKPDILLLILQSIYQKRIIEISYLGSNALSVSERKIEAVGIFFSRTNWYLIGFYLPKEIYLTFRIDRIQKMHILNELQSREHPPLEKFIREFYDKEKLHEIVIRIEKNKTSIMNDDKYYYGLTSEKEIGDMFELHFLTFSISKFAHWYLSFADSATIIRPDSLKYEVKNIINNISI